MKPGVFLAFVVLGLLALPSVQAHGDVRGGEGSVMLAPGEEAPFSADIHWHRLVGHVVARGPDARIEVYAFGPLGQEIAAGPGKGLKVNHLVRCCHDEAWAPHRVSVVNVGPRHANVTFDLTFLHDDFAVIADGAEGGAAQQTLVLVTLFAAVPAASARWLSARNDGLAKKWLRMGWVSLAAGWLILAVLSLSGMLRYGGGPLVGLRAVFATVPLYGAFANSFMLAMLVLMALWVVALSGWAVAERRATDPRGMRTRWLALAAAAGPLVFGVLFAYEYDNDGLAVLLALLPAGVVVGAALWPRRKWHGAKGQT